MLLKGIEVDILKDGSLDSPDNVLAQLDLVLGLIHSKLELSRTKQTKRTLRAMSHPHSAILAHPTRGLIQQCVPYEMDMPCVIREAKRQGCFLKFNAQLERLDLHDSYCQMTREESVLVSINSDAHSAFDSANLRFDIGQTQRGQLEKQNILNSRPFSELLVLLNQTM